MKKITLALLVASALSAQSYKCERVGIKVSSDLGLYSYIQKGATIDVNETSAVLNVVGGMTINGDLKVSDKEKSVTFIDRGQRAAITVTKGDYIIASVAKSGGLSYSITNCKEVK